MTGIITTRDLLRHPFLIAHSFGWRTLARAFRLSCSSGTHTFLEAVATAGR